MVKHISILIVLFLTSVSLFAQHPNKLIRKGNNDFEKGEYNEAEIKYLKALEKDSLDLRALYNRGDAIYKQNNPEEAAQMFNKIIKHSDDKELRADAFYNLGNTLMQTEKYQEAIDAYKQALRNNPSDMDSKYNLQYAMSKLKEQQQQQQQNQDQNKNDQQNQDQNQNQQDQDQKNDDQKDQQNKDQKDQEKKDQDKKDQNKGSARSG